MNFIKNLHYLEKSMENVSLNFKDISYRTAFCYKGKEVKFLLAQRFFLNFALNSTP
jgi:hypothetical protein